MIKLFKMFIAFAKIGLFTFGGGYAMLPMLQRELVDNHGWTTEEELMDYYAIGQCTPGIIAVNVATFVGYTELGLIGALFSTIGIVFPSLVIILAIAAFLQNFAELQIVKDAFAGIRAVICVLILNSVIKLWKQAVKNWSGIIIFSAVFVVALFTDVSKVLIIVAAGILGYAAASLGKGAAK